MPVRRMNSLKSLAMNCGPLSEMMRGRSAGWGSWARTRMHSTSASVIWSRIFERSLGHLVADLPVDDGTAGGIEDRTQVVERPAEVEVRDVDVPVPVGAERLDEASALLRRLLVPAVEQASAGEHAVHARRAGRDDLLVDHHERQPAVAFERKPLVEGD